MSQLLVKDLKKYVNKSKHLFTIRKPINRRNSQSVWHKSFLEDFKDNEDMQPRYDILSEKNHNNMLLHIKKSNKKDLVPQNDSKALKQLDKSIQQKIKNLQNPHQRKNHWFDDLNESKVPLQQKFNVFYHEEMANNFSEIVDQLYQSKKNRVFLVRKTEYSKKRQN